ncbi:MAG: elongation factor P [Campylobacterales bacterium]
MAQIGMGDLKKGLRIEIEGIPYRIVEYQHVKPGKGAAFVRVKIKSFIDGKVLEKTFHAGDKCETPNLEERTMSYSYSDDEYMYFMDDESFEMIPLTFDQVGDAKDWIIEGTKVTVMYHNGKPITVEAPAIVELTVTETAPDFKGDTASGGLKPATLETGATIRVPFHVLEGSKVRVDTRTGEYLDKVK